MSTDQQVEFYRHNLGDEEKARVLAALDDPILTTGRAVTDAENALAEYLRVDHVVCLDSCTAALHLALVAHGIGPGDQVIVPAMTFVATANAVLMAGAEPVFADVDPETGCITAETIAERITERTRAVIPVHLYGLLCDLESISSCSRKQDLIVIEDSAHCLEARRGGVRPGSHSHCACFSFYATKSLTCGEGGALATNDPELADRVRRLARHGLTTSAHDRHGKGYQHWDMPEWGWKYNLDNIRATLLLPQISRLDERWRRRRRIAEAYEAAFADIAGVQFPAVPHADWSARHLFTIWVDPQRRDEILADLQQQRIGVAVNYRAVHLLQYYARRFGYRGGEFPAAEAIGARTISLPLYPQLTADQIGRVVAAVGRAVSRQAAPAVV